MNLNAEVVCDYLVTAEKKRTNAVFLDLLTEFDRLCKRHGLTYWVIWGALLGAVRHKGFIPWDDDVDIGMPLPDYDRLLAMTSEEFGAEEPYFLQSYNTDPYYFQTLMRFRRSDTTCIQDYDLAYIRRSKGEKLYNMGINLTIFPLTELRESPLRRKLQPRISAYCECLEYRQNRPEEVTPLHHITASALLGVIGQRNFARFKHWLYRGWPKKEDAEIQCFDRLYPEPSHYPKSAFADTVYLPFEDITIPVPSGYEEYLRLTYGNYMEFPPLEKRTDAHGGYSDADTPYLVSVRRLLDEP